MQTIQVSVAQLPQLLPESWAADRCLAIVIDVLRFTTTACQALSAGADSVVVEGEIDRARNLASRIGGSVLLCGERHCQKINGFQLGNSPLEYTPDLVNRRELVFSTTNGTQAVLAVAKAAHLALGCFLNRRALAQWAASLVADNHINRIDIVCAGTDGQIACEDVLAAGAIASSLRDQLGTICWKCNDSALVAMEGWASLSHTASTLRGDWNTVLAEMFARSLGGQNLIQTGFAFDLTAASQLDQLQVVPQRVAAPWVKFALNGL